MVRKFWFQVDDKKYDLLLKSFLKDPKGLGFSKKYSSYKIGSVEIITNEEYDLPKITGSINFIKGSIEDKYRDYQEFLSFISQGNVKLYYQTPNTLDMYYCEGIITNLDKGEVEQNGVLTCPFSFKATTTWRNSKQRIVTTINTPTTDKGKYYDLERDYSYAGTSFDNIELVNRGYEDVGFELEIKGNVTDPKLSISQNGKQYGVLQILGTYDYVYINSRDGEEEIYLEQNGSAVANPISYQNMALADGTIDITFLKLKTGTSNAIFAPSNYDGEVNISWFDSFVSV